MLSLERNALGGPRKRRSRHDPKAPDNSKVERKTGTTAFEFPGGVGSLTREEFTRDMRKAPYAGSVALIRSMNRRSGDNANPQGGRDEPRPG